MKPFLLLVLSALAAPAFAQRSITIEHLRSGGGVIERQQGNAVVVRTPEGRITYENGRVRAIEMRGSNRPASGTITLAASSSEQPREFDGTYGEVAGLDRTRAYAVTLRERAARALAGKPALERRREELLAALTAGSRALEDISRTKYTMTKRRTLGDTLEAMRGELASIERSIGAIDRLQSDMRTTEATYAERARVVRAVFEHRKAEFITKNPGRDASAYFAEIEKRLAKHTPAPEKAAAAADKADSAPAR